LLISHHQQHGHAQKVSQKLNIWLLLVVAVVHLETQQLMTLVGVVVLVDFAQAVHMQSLQETHILLLLVLVVLVQLQVEVQALMVLYLYLMLLNLLVVVAVEIHLVVVMVVLVADQERVR
jgi:hypothetical protein